MASRLDLVLMVVGWLSGFLLLSRHGTWTSSAPAAQRRSISVVIPARDEARTLPALLQSLREQHERAAEVIVVDDASADATAEVARRFPDVRVIAGEPLPLGWTGKTWACWQGASAACGDVLLFLDADVRLGPETLASARAELQHHGGLVSVQPLHTVARAIEVLSLPFNVVAVMGIGVLSLVRPRHLRAAAGPFLMCGRADYFQVGGHRLVRSEIVEDMALGRRFDAAGLSVHCVAGIADVRFRMYPGGLRDIVRGWSKNFATGAVLTPRWRAALIAIWVTASLIASLWLLRAEGSAFIAGAVYGVFAVQWAALGHSVGRFGPAALLWPLLAAFFVIVFVWSLVSVYLLRRVHWRGRVIETTPYPH